MPAHSLTVIVMQAQAVKRLVQSDPTAAERAERLGGKLTYGPRPAGGFRVEVVLPR